MIIFQTNVTSLDCEPAAQIKFEVQITRMLLITLKIAEITRAKLKFMVYSCSQYIFKSEFCKLYAS